MRQIFGVPLLAYIAALGIFAESAVAVTVSGDISITYSDGNSEKASNVQVHAVRKRDIDAYLKPLLPDIAQREAIARSEFRASVLSYSAGMTEAAKRAYQQQQKALFERLDAFIPNLLTGFGGLQKALLASTVTDENGEYTLTATGEFYVIVLTSADDDGRTVHHSWLVSNSEISGGRLRLNRENQIPSVMYLYKRFYQ